VTAQYVWLALFLLGCYHGINPGMGWLFAVALGFQERSALAVVKAIVPLVLGHLISVAAIVFVATVAAAQLPHPLVHGASAAILIGYGIYRLIRVRHPRWVGMRVGFWGLVFWGFLMSSAHGAGLMLLPFIASAHAAAPAMAGMPAMPSAAYGIGVGTSLLYVAVHTVGYVTALTAIALVVYWKVGVSFLRTGWLNVDGVWSIALVVTGVIALFT
jgi:hypothetical protein